MCGDFDGQTVKSGFVAAIPLSSSVEPGRCPPSLHAGESDFLPGPGNPILSHGNPILFARDWFRNLTLNQSLCAFPYYWSGGGHVTCICLIRHDWRRVPTSTLGTTARENVVPVAPGSHFQLLRGASLWIRFTE